MAIIRLAPLPTDSSPAPSAPVPSRSKQTTEHARLCALAVKWLRRPNSSRGHGCLFAVSEIATGHGVEVPDAIGWRLDRAAASVVVEVKVSRADFLVDANKPHRRDPESGMGRWRYYMCPEGMIQVEELPPRWGLLWVKGRTVRPIHGPASVLTAQGGHTNYRQFSDLLDQFAFDTTNHDAEQKLMIRLLARVGDPEILNNRIRDGYRRAQFLEQEIVRLSAKCKQLQSELWCAHSNDGAAPSGLRDQQEPE